MSTVLRSLFQSSQPRFPKLELTQTCSVYRQIGPWLTHLVSQVCLWLPEDLQKAQQGLMLWPYPLGRQCPPVVAWCAFCVGLGCLQRDGPHAGASSGGVDFTCRQYKPASRILFFKDCSQGAAFS